MKGKGGVVRAPRAQRDRWSPNESCAHPEVGGDSGWARRMRAQLATRPLPVSILSFRLPGGPERPLSRLRPGRSCTADSPETGAPDPRAQKRPSPKSGQADGGSEDSLHLDIQKLKEKRDLLDTEISQLISEGYSVDELEDHISQLHEYNDIKDVGQMLLGKLAVIRGVTTKELYAEFGLDMND
ncbi:DNA repair protein SWI5 homolog [Panthera onca]|uniref:DNA repair protein SWI5 homolog isoform X1 n=1 Tax=Panthera onca TaxID=9690 RepID=UPI0029532C38|nr:DNA repair protein SWI5 homolog isoform X1 [Panthera onca]